MTKSKKAIFGMLSMLLVAAVAVAGVVMWLTDKTETVTNTFTVGNIDIALEETRNTDTDKDGENDAWTAKMVPGIQIDKDPVVTVEADSEACWLFVTVDESSTLDTYIAYTVDAGWKKLQDGVYYREVAASAADQEFHVLTNDKVSVNGTVTKTQMDALNAEGATQPTLTFQAFAIQKSGFDTAAVAWAEVSNQATA